MTRALSTERYRVNTTNRIPGLPALLVRLWLHLSRRRRRQFVLLLGLMIVSAFAEVVSLGLVLPFLGVLMSPERVMSRPLVAKWAENFGVTSAHELMLPLTIAFAGAALVAGAIRMLLLWASTRLAFASGADLSLKVYRSTLYQPYPVHVARNSSEVISGLAVKVAGSVGVLTAVLGVMSSIVLTVAVATALFAISPIVATLAALGSVGSYVLISWGALRRLDRNSRRIAREQTQVIKALQEGLGGIRDVVLDGTQEVYCEIYRRSDQTWRRAASNNTFIGSSPRFAMEAIGTTLIAVLAYGLSRQPGGITTTLPVLGALALGAQRLLPALQQIYSGWASIAGTKASLADALELLDQPVPAEASQPAPPPLQFEEDIRFVDVRFRYTSNGPWVLDGINLTIPKGARVGFVGSTGGGKSTALDVLTGLLVPTTGQLLVDGQPITGQHARAWQRTIAHVPQSIYLADTTIAENIAFGVPRAEIDMERVRHAARQAHIADFIESRADGYETLVGERGIRLSGGQRQRIGIARALYKQATVLVFDEATSALDNTTEQFVLQGIEELNRDLTILLIAHRHTTVRRCETIVQLEQARVVAQGTYQELLEHSATFRQMAHAVARTH